MKTLFKIIFSKAFFILTMIALVMYGVYTLYRPVMNSITYQYYSFRLDHTINATGNKMLKEQYTLLEEEKIQKIKDIEKEYKEKKINLEVNYNSILKNSLEENKEVLKNKIEKGIPVNDKLLGFIDKQYQDNLFTSIVENSTQDLVFVDYHRIYEPIPEVKELHSQGIFNDIDLSKVYQEYKENPKQIEKEKELQKQKQVSKKFEITVKQELESGIQLLDKSKYENVLPYGITFPSFFSYKSNGINVGSRYFDIHYGVDYKTKPQIYINLPFFKGKKGTVYKTFQEGGGNRMDIVTKNERFIYLHLEKFYLKEGDSVKEDTIIAQTGNTGVSTGPHLHFSYQKDGFYVPYDWGMDFSNEIALGKFGFNKDEVKEIIELGKGDIINMETVIGIFWELKQKHISDFKKIKEAIRESEKNGKMTINQIVEHPIFKNRFSSNNSSAIAGNIRHHVDNFHKIKKEAFKEFLKNNHSKSQDIITFKVSQLGGYITPDKKKVGKENQKKDNNIQINLGDTCNNYTSKVFGKYEKTMIEPYKIGFIKDIRHSKANIEKIAPIIYQEVIDNEAVQKLKDTIGMQDLDIHPCDLVLIELGKWYQEHTFYLDNPKNKAGLFQVLSNNYDNQFPKDIGKKELSIENYKKQSKDSILFSINKFTYNSKKGWKQIAESSNINDAVLKYWLWSFHGLVGFKENGIAGADKNFYTANNLFHSNLPLRDRSATRKTAYKDGGFTVATKLYNNFIKK